MSACLVASFSSIWLSIMASISFLDLFLSLAKTLETLRPLSAIIKIILSSSLYVSDSIRRADSLNKILLLEFSLTQFLKSFFISPVKWVIVFYKIII